MNKKKETSQEHSSLGIYDFTEDQIKEAEENEEKYEDFGFKEAMTSQITGIPKGAKKTVNITGDSTERRGAILTLRNEVDNLSFGSLKAPVPAVLEEEGKKSVTMALKTATDIAKAKYQKTKWNGEDERSTSIMTDIMQVEKLVKRDFQDIYDDEIMNKFNNNTVMILAKELHNHTDKTVVGHFHLRIENDEVKSFITQIPEGGYFDHSKSSIKGRLGFTEGAAQIMRRIEIMGGKETEETVYMQLTKVESLKLNMEDGAEDGKIIMDKIGAEVQILADKRKKLDSEDFPAAITKYHALRKALRNMVDNASPTEEGRLEFTLLLQDDFGSTGTDEGKFQQLHKEASAVFDMMKIKKDKAKKKEVTLNANASTRSKGKGKGKGARGGKGKGKKGVCVNKLRKGYCDRKGCKFAGITKEEYQKIGRCFTDEAKPGSCSRPYCYFRHGSDVWEDKPCVHSDEKSKTGEANVAEPKAAAASEYGSCSDEESS